MAGRGFIKMHREVLNHPTFSHDGLFRLWCFLLLKANWKESSWLVPGTTTAVTIGRGQLITGRESLHAGLYGSLYRGERPASRTVWRWLDSLAEMGCVRVQTVSNRCSLVTVCNYDTYQSDEEAACPEDVPHVSRTCPAPVPHVSTSKETKNIRNQEHNKNAPLEIRGEPVAIPSTLDTPEVRAALAQWLAFKRKKRQAYADKNHVELKLVEFEPHGPLAFVQAVGASIGNNWSGLFVPSSHRSLPPRIGPGQSFDPEAQKRDPNHGRM